MKYAKNLSLIIIGIFLLSPIAYAMREVPDDFKGDIEKIIEKEERFKKEIIEKKRREIQSQQAAIIKVADSQRMHAKNMENIGRRQYKDYQYNIERTKKRMFIIGVSAIAGFLVIIVGLILLRKRLLGNVLCK